MTKIENVGGLIFEIGCVTPFPSQRITFDPAQCGGRPCIRGVRIRVKDVLDLLAAGVSEADILEYYPYLEKEDIAACLKYAAAEVDYTILTAPSR